MRIYSPPPEDKALLPELSVRERPDRPEIRVRGRARVRLGANRDWLAGSLRKEVEIAASGAV